MKQQIVEALVGDDFLKITGKNWEQVINQAIMKRVKKVESV